MASQLLTSSAVSSPAATCFPVVYSSTPRHVKCASMAKLNSFSAAAGALILLPYKNSQNSVASRRSSSTTLSHSLKALITDSCSAQPETLKIVQSTIAKQLSIDETTIDPATKFADLGADSLDTIMMALEEQFEVSIGESGAENSATVQDAADLIEKVKAASA